MFKTLTGVLNKNNKFTDEQIEKVPSYIFCKWLSGNPVAIFAGNQINQYDKIPMLNQYKMINSAFAGKIKFIPYPKNTSEKKHRSIKILCEHFKINETKALEYLDLIDKDELNEILQIYTDAELKG